jgi:glutaconate CoA-transferase, subunit B
MNQDKRKFASKLDYITTPGYLNGSGMRERAGLPRNCGPSRVVTQLGVYGFESETKRMNLVSLHPGVSVGQILENSSFPIIIPDKIVVTTEPTEEEINILKELDTLSITSKG